MAEDKKPDGGQLVDHRDGRDVVLKLRGVRTQFGDNIVHDNLDFDVFRGEIVGLVGGSGSGKSVLLRTIIGLNPARRGRIEVLGTDTHHLHGKAERTLQSRTGVQFQDGALFSGLTVAENIIVPIREHAGLDEPLMQSIAALKIAMAGLPPDTGDKKPSELSGGMRKRASLARALALDPELLFLDEPTAGLDPIGAAHYDELIGQLRQSLGLTVLMVTHDLDSLHAVCDRIAVLLDKRVVVGTMEEMLAYDHPWVREYFHGPRGRAAIRQRVQNLPQIFQPRRFTRKIFVRDTRRFGNDHDVFTEAVMVSPLNLLVRNSGDGVEIAFNENAMHLRGGNDLVKFPMPGFAPKFFRNVSVWIFHRARVGRQAGEPCANGIFQSSREIRSASRGHQLDQ